MSETSAAQDWPWQIWLPDVAFSACAYPLDGRIFHVAGLVLPASLQRAVPRRQAEFLAGRHAARTALQQAGGQGVPQSGADRAPIWPAGFVGSISHSHGIAVAVAAAQLYQAGLGIDLEQLFSKDQAAELAPQILHPLEQALPGRNAPWALTLAFSLKESLFKALYPQVGRMMDFQAASIVGWQDGRAELRLQQDWSASWRAGHLLSCHYAEYCGGLLSLVALPTGAASYAWQA